MPEVFWQNISELTEKVLPELTYESASTDRGVGVVWGCYFLLLKIHSDARLKDTADHTICHGAQLHACPHPPQDWVSSEITWVERELLTRLKRGKKIWIMGAELVTVDPQSQDCRHTDCFYQQSSLVLSAHHLLHPKVQQQNISAFNWGSFTILVLNPAQNSPQSGHVLAQYDEIWILKRISSDSWGFGAVQHVWYVIMLESWALLCCPRYTIRTVLSKAQQQLLRSILKFLSTFKMTNEWWHCFTGP